MRNLSLLNLILILIFSSIVPLSVTLAWGPIGHRVVGEIAYKNLNFFTKKKVDKILEKESMAKASTWADEIKSDPDQYRHTFDWHYMSWPNGEEEYQYKSGTGRLKLAIEEQTSVLKNVKSSKEEKLFALRFLIHLIGDLHQPLHVGNGHDRGGNDCKVFFHSEKTNLHRLWDEDIINRKKLSYRELADFVSYFSAEETKQFMKGSPMDWAKESKSQRLNVYPTDLSSRPYCKRGAPESSYPKLGYSYSYEHYQLIEKRLYQGGVRLASLLNKIL